MPRRKTPNFGIPKKPQGRFNLSADRKMQELTTSVLAKRRAATVAAGRALRDSLSKKLGLSLTRVPRYPDVKRSARQIEADRLKILELEKARLAMDRWASELGPGTREARPFFQACRALEARLLHLLGLADLQHLSAYIEAFAATPSRPKPAGSKRRKAPSSSGFSMKHGGSSPLRALSVEVVPGVSYRLVEEDVKPANPTDPSVRHVAQLGGRTPKQFFDAAFPRLEEAVEHLRSTSPRLSKRIRPSRKQPSIEDLRAEEANFRGLIAVQNRLTALGRGLALAGHDPRAPESKKIRNLRDKAEALIYSLAGCSKQQVPFFRTRMEQAFGPSWLSRLDPEMPQMLDNLARHAKALRILPSDEEPRSR